MDYSLNIVSKCRFFFIFKHSLAPKRSWKNFSWGSWKVLEKSWIFFVSKRVGALYYSWSNIYECTDCWNDSFDACYYYYYCCSSKQGLNSFGVRLTCFVCPSVTVVLPARALGQNEKPFFSDTHVTPTNIVLDRGNLGVGPPPPVKIFIANCGQIFTDE